MRNLEGALLPILCIALMTCESLDEHYSSSPPDLFLGSWCWIRTTGGIAGIDDSPATTGETGRIQFNSTEMTGYENESVIYSRDYHLGRDLSLLTHDSISVIYWGDSLAFGYRFEGDDSLALWDEVIDGYYFSYIRQ